VKPSEVTRRPASEREKPKGLRMSARANPPISADEAKKAGTAVCPWHNGLISTWGAPDGSVHHCPIGKMYWRYVKRTDPPMRLPEIGILRLDEPAASSARIKSG